MPDEKPDQLCADTKSGLGISFPYNYFAPRIVVRCYGIYMYVALIRNKACLALRPCKMSFFSMNTFPYDFALNHCASY